MHCAGICSGENSLLCCLPQQLAHCLAEMIASRASLACCGCCLLCLQVLHLVDFDQLKIENQQYLERIDAKNRELLQLKLSTGRTVQVSTVHN